MKTAFIIAAASSALSANAQLIDFESLPNGSLPMDDMVVGNTYNTDAFNFATFSLSRDNGATFTDAFFEAVGSDSVDGFVANVNGNNDTEGTILDGQPGLGSFFLRDDRNIQDTGRPLSLFITFNEAFGDFAPTRASGQIWDIDGVENPNSPSFGTEKWDVIVTDILGNEEVLATSPEGLAPDGPLDALPWLFEVEDLDGIAQIELRFTGTKDNGLGVAFDNFNTGGVIPSPASLALIGLGGAIAGRRRA